MKISKFTIKFALFLTFAFAAFQNAQAQTAYGLADIVYDSVTKKVTSYSGTYLDYAARLHYDPAVCGNIYQSFTRIGANCYTGYNSYYQLPQSRVYGSTVSLRTINPSPPDTRYDVISDHYVVAYFYTEVIILDDDEEIIIRRDYYDPSSLNKQGGQSLGFGTYSGNTNQDLGQFYQYQYFYLGSTGRGIIANPTSCPDSFTSCPAPLRVQIRNEFTGTEDLSASSTVRNALVATTVELDAVVSGGNNTALTYVWLDNNAPINGCNSDKCLFNILDKEEHNIKLIVEQANQPSLTKTFKLRGALPTFVASAATPYPVVNGYSGVERIPRVTTGGGDCSYSSVRLMLGCAARNSEGQTAASAKNTGGLYLKAIVVPPGNLISKADQSVVAFYQVIKAQATRSGRLGNGQNFTEKRLVNNYDPPRFSLDFQGEINSNPNYTFSKRLTNSDSSNITLDYADAPNDPLENETAGGFVREYNANQEFKTYITYLTARAIGGTNPEIRQPLRVINWNWYAKARKTDDSTPWKLFGAYFPEREITLSSTEVPFGTAEEVAYGNYRTANFTWVRTTTVNPTVTITTKRNVAVWRKTNGYWYVMNQDGTVLSGTQWGVDYDVPVPGDYDGDGKADFAVYRADNPATPEDECQNGCYWYVLKSSNGTLQSYLLGSRDDKPVPADFDGDGRTDIAVYRPSNGVWYSFKSSNNLLNAVQFGNNADVPVPSDYNGDGIDDVAVWSPGSATWSIQNSGSQAVTNQIWGTASDKPVIGDYDGDGKTDIANWQSNGNWHILLSGNSQTKDVVFGLPASDTPVPGDYDGDGKTDIAIWRSNGTQPAEWHILNSSNNQIQVQFFGTEGDIPTPAAYNP